MPAIGALLLDALLKAAEGSPIESLVVVAAYTGMRRGEFPALRWEDADLGRGVVHVRRSSGIGRAAR